MSEWQTLSLGKAGVRLIDCVHKTPAALSDGYAYVAIPDMKSGHISFDNARRISDSDFAEWTKKAKPQAHDVILSRRTNPGVTAVDTTNTPFALGQNLVLLRADGRSVFPPFLRWLCLSPAWWEQIEKYINVGAVFSSLRCGDVPNFELPIPPLFEQREIAAILGALDDKIELNRKTAATLEEMARALYRSWFVDFDPVRARTEGRTSAHMDPTTAALFPDSFGEDGLPVGWTLGAFGTVCKQMKQTVKPMEATDADFWHFSLPAFDSGRAPTFEQGAQIKSNKLFVPNDAILFSRLNPSIPRVWWARSDHAKGIPAASTEFFVAVARSEKETPWLYCLLSSPEFQEQAVSRVTGTSNSHQRVSATALSDIGITTPAVEIIAAFGNATVDWFERIHALGEENCALATLRDTLLPRLMSGELRVGAAREFVEEVV